MNFNHLEYALAVAKYGSISKAYQNLFMSQPYLSSMIKNLEAEVGYQIFDRTSSGIVLTKEGEQFMKSARIILLELKKMKELNIGGEEKQLNISCYYATFIMEMFLKFCNAAQNKLPDKIKEMGNEEVMESVLAGESTMGIIFYAQKKQDIYEAMAKEYGLYMKELIKPMNTYVVLSKCHPLAVHAALSIRDLNTYPYVSYDDASSKKYLKLLGIEDHPLLLEVSDRGSFYDALKSGQYLSVMAFRSAPEQEWLTILPFRDKKLLLNSSYVTAPNHQLTRREKAFLSFVKSGGKI